MILIGNLDSLSAEYCSSWSGRCRGNPRKTFVIEAGKIVLRLDFIRWLRRRAIKNKEDNMVLVQRIERPGATVLVFEGNDEGKTVEQLVAEVICRLAPNGGPVDSWAIHFSSMHHPFSTMQRLRELAASFKKWWLEDYFTTHDGMETFIPGSDDYAYRFVKKEFKYYFSLHFVNWLRREYLESEKAAI